MASIRSYYRLGKPGIIWANVMTAIAGYLFGSGWHIRLGSIFGLLIGTTLVIAGACIVNNYIDRGIDAMMARTKKRALVTGEIKTRPALIIAGSYLLTGFVILIVLTNWLTVLAGFIGLLDYVVFYGWAKRRSGYSTLIGSISGAMPILSGYLAATGRMNMAGLLLFLVMTFWQMPHFYAIGLFRRQDYAKAGLPILPVTHKADVVRLHMMFYMAAFLAAAILLTGLGYAGLSYFVVIALTGFYWLWLAINPRRPSDYARWAKNIFVFSLMALMVFSLMISVNSFLP